MLALPNLVSLLLPLIIIAAAQISLYLLIPFWSALGKLSLENYLYSFLHTSLASIIAQFLFESIQEEV